MSLSPFLSNYKQKNIGCNREKEETLSYDIREALGMRPLG
jgi:hypothetical protein